MYEAGMKQLFYFSLAVLLALILFWFGSKFLFFTSDHISDTQYFIFGIFLTIGGVFMLSSPDFRSAWKISVLITLSGFYFFARAADIIEMPWLARILGVSSWLAALLALYITWPGHRQHAKKDRNETIKN